MSLSKPVIDVPPLSRPAVISSTPSTAAPAWSLQQIGLIIGIPVTVISAVGIYYWLSQRRVPSDSKPSSTKKPTSSQENGSSKPVEKSKPKYVQIKDVGNDMFRNADYAGALESYAAAMEESPPPDELAKLYQNRAAVFEKMGDWVQLIRETSAALEIDPKYIKARHRRAKAYQKTGFLNEALEDVTAACMLENFSRQSTIMMADEILKEIGLKEATKLMQTKKPTAPSDHAITSFLRSFYCDPVTKWWSDRDTDYLEIFQCGPKYSESKTPVGDNSDGDSVGVEQVSRGFIAAIEALKDSKYGNILNLCTEELRNPESKYQAEAYLLRGTFRFLWGFGDEVVADLTEVTDSKTAEPMLKSSAWVKKGLRYALIGDTEKCDECFQKAEKACPENVDVYHHLGQCRLTLGNFEGAVELIDKAHQICPDFAIAAASKWYTQFRVASQSEDRAAMLHALENFKKLLGKFPNVPDIFNLYGQVLMELGEFKEACEEFSTVFRLDPGNAAVYVHYAMCKFRMNQNMDQAISLLRESLKIDDKCEFVYETLGTLELQSGDLNAAIISITKALDLAKTQNELVMLCSLKRAAEVQSRMKGKFESPAPMTNGMSIPQ